MKKIVIFLTAISFAFAIPPCENGIDACAYVYKTPITKEIQVINMRHVPILFSVGGKLAGRKRAVYNRVLQPYQRYTLLKKQYKNIEENKKSYASYQWKIQNYNPKIKQDLKLKYPY